MHGPLLVTRGGPTAAGNAAVAWRRPLACLLHEAAILLAVVRCHTARRPEGQAAALTQRPLSGFGCSSSAWCTKRAHSRGISWELPGRSGKSLDTAWAPTWPDDLVGALKADEPSYTPGFVPRDLAVVGETAIHLGPALPSASCGLPADLGGQPSNVRAERLLQRLLLTLLRVGFT